MLTKNLAIEVEDVAFLTLHPGWVDTDMGAAGGRRPPVTPDDSAAGIYKLGEALSIETSGAFWSAVGDRELSF